MGRRARRATVVTTLALLAGGAGTAHAASISGRVFDDFNANGTRDVAGALAAADDAGVGDVTVSAYQGDSQTPVATATTSALAASLGTYTLTNVPAGPTRVEFTGLPAGFIASRRLPASTDNFTTVQFVDTSDNTPDTNVSLGVQIPEDFCSDNPLVAVCEYSFGTKTPNSRAIVAFPYDNKGLANVDQSGQQILATESQVGSVYGEAFDPSTGDLYAAAYMKRHVAFGPGGPGAIYRIPYDATAGTYGAPYVYTTVPNAGADPHDTGDYLFDNGPKTFDVVGKTSLGDLDVAADGSRLYVTNLATGALVGVPLDAAHASQTGKLAGSATTSTAVPVPASCTTATDWHPFAVSVHRGVVSVGGTCGNDSLAPAAGSTAAASFQASIEQILPAPPAGSQPTFAFPLNYPRKCANDSNPQNASQTDGAAHTCGNSQLRKGGDFHAWITAADAPPGLLDGTQGDSLSYPQPMLTDIEYDGSDVILGLRDRFADQMGQGTPGPLASNQNLNLGVEAGDMLRACPAGGTGALTLESNGGCGTRTSTGGGNNEGPGGGEFYNSDDTTVHDQTFIGAMAQVPGFTNVLSTEFDPFYGASNYFSGGVQWANSADGSRRDTMNIYTPVRSQINDGFGKSNGLGDLEARCLSAPLQIGNRVWLDSDDDGIQDPGEPPIAGVHVGLFRTVTNPDNTTTTTQIGPDAVTDAKGEYYFDLQPSTPGYSVRIDPTQTPLQTYKVSPANQGGSDLRDSDGKPVTTGAATADTAAVDALKPGANSHDFDFGFAPSQYDLALRKTLISPTGPVAPGQDVTFRFTVFNQSVDSGAGVTNVQVTDYLPAGFIFNQSSNPDWTRTGTLLTQTLPGPIKPGGSTTVDIVLRVSPITSGHPTSLRNVGEISSFKDLTGTGPTPPDVDSTPDQINGNGNDLTTDNAITGTGTGTSDEDDADFEDVPLAQYDLALRKTTQAGFVAPGMLVPFTITVFNQAGSSPVQNVLVSDYVPAGYTFDAADNTGWTAVPNSDPVRLTRTVVGPIAVNGSVGLTVNLRVAAGATDATLVNAAEISAFQGAGGVAGGTPPDVDSTPDTILGNGNDLLTDDAIGGNGQGTQDEDDADVAATHLTRYDLALQKATVLDDPIVAQGSDVDFTITVLNQGDAGANVRNVTITDTFPAGTTLDDPDWTPGPGPRQAQITLRGPLNVGGQPLQVPITLKLDDTAPGNTTLQNDAEISKAFDTSAANGGAGIQITDADSTPDTIDGNGNDLLTDDAIDGTGTGASDEDDADFARFKTPRYDLALRKTAPAGAVAPGDTVPFTITVFNQGDVSMQNVEVIDTYDPSAYTFTTAGNSGWTPRSGSQVVTTIPGPIAPGASTPVVVNLKVSGAATNATLINRAEISAFQNLDAVGYPSITDVDSTPGSDPTDDPGDLSEDDIIDNTGGDEDDEDPARVTLVKYDLALRKTVVSPSGPISPGELVHYGIQVFNQNTAQPASRVTNVKVVDTLPAGLIFVPSADPGWSVVPGGSPDGRVQITRTIAGPLAPSATPTVLPLVLRVASGAIRDTNPKGPHSTRNVAGIASFRDALGGPATDVDSTPSANPGGGNDLLTDDDITGNGQGDQDEDDADYADIPVDTYDLALTKVRADGTAPVAPTDTVPFTITVLNQSRPANATVTNVRVVDYIPAGFAFVASENPSWSLVPGDPNKVMTTVPGPIAPGASADVAIKLRVKPGTTDARALRNAAEIVSFSDAVGTAQRTDDTDSTPDAILGNGNDLLTDDATTGNGQGTQDEDDADFANVPLATYDLALRKTTTATNVAPGDLVPFTIQVFNQGTSPRSVVKDVRITDTIPAGLAFSPNDNSGWASSAAGQVQKTIAGPLAPGASTTVTINLRVLPTATEAQLLNHAEISRFEDLGGNAQKDTDSTPDAIQGNDTEVDNVIDNSGGDEDDEDVAAVTLARYDLALRKTTTADRVAVGDLVPFTIDVFNQATDPRAIATTITITDTIPAGYTFAASENPGWTSGPAADQVQQLISGPLAPGAQTSIVIRLRVKPGATDATLENFAEISSFQGINQPGINLADADSTPDTNPTNDGFPTDNAIDNENGDEDDSDIAPVTLARYDLAIRKTTTATQATPGQLVPFAIEVFNQSADARAIVTNTVVTDTLPSGFTFDPALNPGWSDAGNGQIQATITGPLAPGASTPAPPLELRVAAGTPDETATNDVEISSFEDTAGDHPPDVDSTPDTNPTNDTTVDDVIDNAGGDEDDFDIATVPVVNFDLALRKTVPDAPVHVGNAVPFTITVFNQATSPLAAVKDVIVTDSIPAGFDFRPSDNPGWTLLDNGQAQTAIPGPLAAGDTATTGIVLRVRADATDSGLANIAEISAFTDTAGDEVPDVDSTPDTDPSNDNLVDDVIDNTGGDEDDQDIARVLLAAVPPPVNTTPTPRTTLAVKKVLFAAGLVSGKKASYKLTVTNTGGAPARNVTLCDDPTSEVVYVSATRKATLKSGDACFSLGTLAAGASRSVTVRTRITADAEGNVVNKATAAATNAKLVHGQSKEKTKAKPARAEGVTG